MTSILSIRYFRRLGLRLWQAPGRLRGAWNLAPFGSPEEVECFESLGDLWRCWRLMVLHAVVQDEAMTVALGIARRNEEAKEVIRRWALSDQSERLPEDMEFEICLPYLTVDVSKKRIAKLARDEMSAFAWAAWRTNFNMGPRIVDQLSEVDRHLLDATTVHTGTVSGLHQRL
jgi:hypothetical protein